MMTGGVAPENDSFAFPQQNFESKRFSGDSFRSNANWLADLLQPGTHHASLYK